MPLYITNVPIRCTINAAIHATIHCPSTTYAAHFAPSSPLDRCNSRNTWCIQQTEDQKACCCHRRNCSRQFCRTSKEYRKRRYHTFLCHKSCDQCSRNLPVSETKRKEYRCNDSCHNCQDTVLGICHHIHV